jgi:hypothetical protein
MSFVSFVLHASILLRHLTYLILLVNIFLLLFVVTKIFKLDLVHLSFMYHGGSRCIYMFH